MKWKILCGSCTRDCRRPPQPSQIRAELLPDVLFLSNRYVVSFVMPSKYKTKADLPEPNNPNLRLREVDAHTVAAIAWRYGLVLTVLHSFFL